MKKIFPLILLSLFSIWFSAGFLLSSKFFTRSNRFPSNPYALSGYQSVLLLIHVDELHSSHLKLGSIYALFMDFSNTPTLTFKNLAPASLLNSNIPVARKSLFTNQLEPSSELIKLLRIFQLPWAGFIIFDDDSLKEIPKTANMNLEDQSMNSLNSGAIFYQNDATLLQQFCFQVTRQTGNFSADAWNKFFISSLKTDIPTNTLSNLWNKIFYSEKLPVCEVIVSP